MAVIRTLVVDDSTLMRRFLTDLLEKDREIKVVGTARNGLDALEKCQELDPDLITMDVEMPEMDGLTALQHVMKESPRPVVMVSAMGDREADITMKALRLGAVDFIPKTSGSLSLDIEKASKEIISKVKAAARAKVERSHFANREPMVYPGLRKGDRDRLVMIGASTGGPKALIEVISTLPANLPAGVLVVQHMPEGFTRSFADHLNAASALEVKEAEEGDEIVPGRVLVAPGGLHLVVVGDHVHLSDSKRIHFVRPAVDVTMKSGAPFYGGRCLGVILTGMGNDGLEGMMEIKRNGGSTIAQDEDSCVVYGMPKAVVENGLADYVLPLNKVAERIVSSIGG